ncbi:oligosaccharide flippase family protein, partial [Methylobacterium sp. P5_C11]
MRANQSTPSIDGSAQIRAAKGASWLIAGKFSAKIMDALVLVVLARLLGPTDFGLVALAMSFVVISEAILEIPVSQALLIVPDLTEEHLNTAFTLGFIRAMIIVVTIAILSYPLAHFTGEPRLTNLLIILAFAPAIRGIASPRLIVYIKDLDFRRDFAAEVTGKFVGGMLAVTIAFTFRTYWALAAATLASPAAMTVTSYLIAPHRPRLTLAKWNVFSHFVSWSFFTQLFIALSWQCDRVLLGRYVAAADLGRYTICNDMTNLPHQALILPITRPLATVIYTKSGDLQGLQASYLLASSVIATFIAPIYVGLFFLAGPAIQVMLGQNWDGADHIAAVLALAFLPGLPAGPWRAVALAREKSHWLTAAALAELGVRLPLTWYMVSAHGAEGAAWTRVIVSVMLCGIAIICIKRLIAISIFRQIYAVIRPAIAASVMAMVVWPLSVHLMNAPSKLFLSLELASVVLIGGVVYVSVLFLT